MSPSTPFIKRPVATALLMLAIVLAGLVGFKFLPLAALPQVDFPTIQVQTLYPGASPEVMGQTVTAPLERQFGEMAGLQRMSSTSAAGVSIITLQFTLGQTLDVAEQEVQAAINAGGSLLPTDLPAPPVYAKVNPADAPVLTLAITSDTMPLTEVQNIVNTRLALKISQVTGVGLVTLSGGQRPAVRIQADTLALASYGLGLDTLRTAISNANANSAKGSFDGPTRSFTINANDQLLTANDNKNLIVSYRNGAPVRLSEVAKVVDSAENVRLGAWANMKPAIILNVQRQPGANVIATVDAIKARLPELQAGLPAAMRMDVLSDRTTGIRASVEHVEIELVLAVLLVVLVIFLFLHSVRATVIASLAVPISLIGTCGAMYLLGYSLNNLSLMALTIATGFVVDDAIVMIENIARYIEKGEKPMAAAIKGATQIGFTIISLTVSLIAVLIPLLFMGDVVGRLFREFAVTLAVSILISAFISLTLTPMMCARLLKHVPEEKQGRFYHASGQFFDNIIAYYGRKLEWVLDHQNLTLLVALGTLVLTALLYMWVPKGFFPLQDTGAIQGISEASQSISFSAMAVQQESLAKKILQDPAVESLSSFIGVDGANASLNSGRLLINLKPKESRDNIRVVTNRLQQMVSEIPGMSLYLQPVQDLSIDARVSRTQYQFTLQATNPEDLSAWTPKLINELQKLPALADVASDLQDKGLQAYVQINRDTASRLGVTTAAIDNALYDAFGQRLISTIFTQTNQYRVVLEADPSAQQGPLSLKGIYVPTLTGGPIPLDTVATIEQRSTSLTINHLGQFPTATISFNLSKDASLGEAVEAIHQTEAQLGMPASIETRFQGAAMAFQASLSNTLWLILAAIITMYIVLGVLYESYIHPITILSTLPSAGIGALLALLVSGTELSVIAIIGIILLIGIVKKNAIMMIDFALEAERNEGKSPREAIYQACLLRFRPILMTTMAALLGALPLMLGGGMGSELRAPLGVTMVGGLMVSQVLTLFTTPVIYLAFDRLARRFGKVSAPIVGDEVEV